MISERLKQVILKELDIEDVVLTDSTLASEVPGWDSLNHAKVLCAVEQEFGLHFKTLEMLRLKNLGDLQALIDKNSGR